MNEKEEKKMKEYEIFLKEKQMIDEIVRKIHEEDNEQVLSRMESQKRRRNSLDKYLQDREEWKRLERERMEEENRKIMEFAKQQTEVIFNYSDLFLYIFFFNYYFLINCSINFFKFFFREQKRCKQRKRLNKMKKKKYSKNYPKKWKNNKEKEKNMKISSWNWLLLKKKKDNVKKNE